jgi:acetyl-CoA carboxylase biotin carboxyl carrier protein
MLMPAAPGVAHAAAPLPALAAATADPVPEEPEGVVVKAPMVGTFYRAPKPGAPPYTEVGARVTVGQTLCIIEAMKLMNEIEAENDGVVAEIYVENENPVQFGQPLYRIVPG